MSLIRRKYTLSGRWKERDDLHWASIVIYLVHQSDDSSCPCPSCSDVREAIASRPPHPRTEPDPSKAEPKSQPPKRRPALDDLDRKAAESIVASPRVEFEIPDIVETVRGVVAERDQLRAQVADLTEALRPFAEKAKYIIGSSPEADFDDASFRFAVWQFRHAAAVLAKVKP